ncbi:MAG: DNA repair protein RecO [Coriobacteriia bacterium]|nr:DNA repair protein RecO [Coriobacteriia bacterium]
MPAYRLRALVLRKTKLGETDLIVTLLAEDGRQVRAVAKGARKPGARIGGKLEPLSTADLLLHTGRNLDVVAEAQLVDGRAGLLADYERTTAASVVADVLDKLSQEGLAEERFFALAEAALGELERADGAAVGGLVAAFLVKALAMAGYRPAVGSCARCAREEADGDVFSFEAGGALCGECAQRDETGSARFAREAREALAALLAARMREVPELGVPDAVVRECIGVLRAFLGYHTGARLRSLDVFTGG